MNQCSPISIVVIRTSRLEQSLAFYRAFGLVFQEERHGSGPAHYSTVFESGLVFEIYPAASGDAPDRKLGGATMLGFRVKNVTAVTAQLAILNVQVISEPRQTEWGLRALVLDPDGRAVEIVG